MLHILLQLRDRSTVNPHQSNYQSDIFKYIIIPELHFKTQFRYTTSHQIQDSSRRLEITTVWVPGLMKCPAS